MTLFGGYLTLVICAALAALFSGDMPSKKPVDVVGEENFQDPGKEDKESNPLEFLHNESFYRNFIINMNFGGIAIASASLIHSPSAFFDFYNTSFLLLLNLLTAIVSALILKDNPKLVTSNRQKWVVSLVVMSLLVVFMTGAVLGGWQKFMVDMSDYIGSRDSFTFKLICLAAICIVVIAGRMIIGRNYSKRRNIDTSAGTGGSSAA